MVVDCDHRQRSGRSVGVGGAQELVVAQSRVVVVHRVGASQRFCAGDFGCRRGQPRQDRVSGVSRLLWFCGDNRHRDHLFVSSAVEEQNVPALRLRRPVHNGARNSGDARRSDGLKLRPTRRRARRARTKVSSAGGRRTWRSAPEFAARPLANLVRRDSTIV